MANVADVKSKAVKITLMDGVERELRFTLNAMAELEERYGTVDAAMKALDTGSIKAIRCVIWAGLSHEDNALTEQQVGNLIDMQYMNTLSEKLAEAFNLSMPKAEDENSDGVQNPNV